MADGTLPPLARLETGVPGLDAVLDGGLVAGATCLVVGAPGTGKTTLANQVAFHHAAGGGTALFVTVLAESHERMLRRLATFRFFDPELVGTRVHYLDLLDPLDDSGIDGLLAAARREIRARQATLLVIDRMTLVEELAVRPIEFRRFVSRLQAATALAGCTTLLLGGNTTTGLPPGATEADGILDLSLDAAGVRDQRALHVVKLRGTEHLLGRHDVSIGRAGLAVHPRLESLVGRERTAKQPADRLSTGIIGLDAMLGGGLLPGTSTLLLGTPGSGKTNTGLQFVAAGLAGGERGLIATFHEDAAGLADTVAGVDLRRAMDDGRVEVFWQAPLEASPDAWAWDLLGRVERHRAQRLFIDGLSDIHRLHRFPERVPSYLTALTNELRRRRITVVGTVEIDAFVAPELTTPIPAVPAMVDNGILLRQVEIRSRLRRLVSVLKARRSETDPAIREFRIGPGGVEIGEPFRGAAALLTGAALPEPRTEPDLGPAAERS